MVEITSGIVDNTFLGFLLEAAVAMFAVISKTRDGFDNTVLANFLPTLTEVLPKYLNKLPSPSANKIRKAN